MGERNVVRILYANAHRTVQLVFEPRVLDENFSADFQYRPGQVCAFLQHFFQTLTSCESGEHTYTCSAWRRQVVKRQFDGFLVAVHSFGLKCMHPAPFSGNGQRQDNSISCRGTLWLEVAETNCAQRLEGLGRRKKHPTRTMFRSSYRLRHGARRR